MDETTLTKTRRTLTLQLIVDCDPTKDAAGALRSVVEFGTLRDALSEAGLDIVEWFATDEMTIRVRAEAHTDDHAVRIEFDAAAWLRVATDQEIIDLARCGWGGDYPADAVARYFEDDETRDLFEHVQRRNAVGYECHVDGGEARRWLARHRPELHAQLSPNNRMKGSASMPLSSSPGGTTGARATSGTASPAAATPRKTADVERDA